MKRPLVAVVSCYATGLLLAELFHPPLVALFGIAFVVLVLACPTEASARRRVLVLEKLRPLLLWLLIAFVGWTNLASRTAIVSPNDLRALLGDTNAIVTVRGTLIETPHLRITERDGQQTERSVAQVQVTALRRDDANWRPAAGSIIVTTPGALAGDFFAGQPVEATGVISQPASPLAEGLFDYRDYLQTRGIFYQLKTGSTNGWQLGAAPLIKPPLTDRFLDWSKHTLALGLPEDEPLHLLWAMTLGWRTAFTADISEMPK